MVSVLMAVHNGFPLIKEAVVSILTQSESDLEFIVVDDGSTDETYGWLKALPDKRLKLIRNKKQIGLSRSLNKGLRAASGKYVARMDYDDISLKTRLALQSKFMDSHAEVDVLGTWARTIGRFPVQTWRYPVFDKEIKAELLFNPVLVHGSVMLRRSTFTKEGLEYDPKITRSQDYELWARARDQLRFANLSEVLLLYRIHPQQVGIRYGQQQQKVAMRVRLGILRKMGINPSKSELDLQNAVSQWAFPTTLAGLRNLEAWFLKILASNQQSNVFEPTSLARSLEQRWWAACRRNSRTHGRSIMSVYRSSPISTYNKRSIYELITINLKSIFAR